MIGKRRGFTLIELLVVIAIIAILAAILFPVFAKAKDAAQASRCVSNLKQINTALVMYVDSFNGYLPGGSFDSTGYAKEPYHCRILDAIRPGSNWAATYNRRYMQDYLAPYIKNAGVWICPSINRNAKFPDPSGNPTNYKWSQNTGTGFGGMALAKSAPTSYGWTFMYLGRDNNGNALNKYASGACTSKISKASKAAMFMEMPWWSMANFPHSLNNSEGIHVSYYDGHVRFTRPPTDKDSYSTGWGAYAQYGWSDSFRQ